MPNSNAQRQSEPVPASRIEFEIEFANEGIGAHELIRAIDQMDSAISLFCGNWADLRSDVSELRGLSPAEQWAFRSKARHRLALDSVHYGSPLSVIGKISGMSETARRAMLGFFRNMIFYDETKSKRAAEAALAWEQVVAARLENARAVATMLAKDDALFIGSIAKDEADAVSASADETLSTVSRLIELEWRFRSQSWRLTDLVLGDDHISRRKP